MDFLRSELNRTWHLDIPLELTNQSSQRWQVIIHQWSLCCHCLQWLVLNPAAVPRIASTLQEVTKLTCRKPIIARWKSAAKAPTKDVDVPWCTRNFLFHPGVLEDSLETQSISSMNHQILPSMLLMVSLLPCKNYRSQEDLRIFEKNTLFRQWWVLHCLLSCCFCLLSCCFLQISWVFSTPKQLHRCTVAPWPWHHWHRPTRWHPRSEHLDWGLRGCRLGEAMGSKMSREILDPSMWICI